MLDYFIKNLSYKPYRTNKKGNLGIAKKEMAIKSKLLQHNQPCLIHWIVLDCDNPCAYENANLKYTIPPPNIVVCNPKNSHSHLFFGLKAPVCTSSIARKKPIEYLACIQYALTEMFEADISYNNFISKNPLHEEHDTYVINKNLWELNDFREYLTLPNRVPKKIEVFGLGRNCTLFEVVRKWAYKEVLAHRVSGSYQSFFNAVLERCEQVNANFPEPLFYFEIKATAKSITKWTWKRYTGRIPDDEFSEIQAERGRKSGKKRLLLNQDKRVQAKELYANGIKQSEIAKILNVTQQAISKWLRK